MTADESAAASSDEGDEDSSQEEADAGQAASVSPPAEAGLVPSKPAHRPGAQAAEQPPEPVLRILPLGSGLVLIGLGLGLAFIGLRMRRA
ncbi:hypothetical protein ACIBW9_13730 [Streptomyces sp. NPDC049541]|uniref:hypothetical protein n=1 Tax=Streptomyces sp. NPDC049541 TaxID=3365594 RepID=UPI0037A44068